MMLLGGPNSYRSPPLQSKKAPGLASMRPPGFRLAGHTTSGAGEDGPRRSCSPLASDEGTEQTMAWRDHARATERGWAQGWGDDQSAPATPTRKTRFVVKDERKSVFHAICGAYDPKPKLPRAALAILEELNAAEKARVEQLDDLWQEYENFDEETACKRVRWSAQLVQERILPPVMVSDDSSDDDVEARPPRLPGTWAATSSSVRPRSLPKSDWAATGKVLTPPGTRSAAGACSAVSVAGAKPNRDGRPRLPRNAADLLKGLSEPSFSSFVQPTSGPNFIQQLVDKGLLPALWPAGHVLMGLCVSRQLNAELTACSNVVVEVRPGGDLPTDRVLQTLTGTFIVSARASLPTPKPSESTRSIRSFMKSLLVRQGSEEDADALRPGNDELAASEPPDHGASAAAAAAAAAPATRKGLPLARLRSVRHRIAAMDLENCGVGVDAGGALGSLLMTYQYRGRCQGPDMSTLTRVELARNQLGVAPALWGALASLPNLQVLNVAHNQVRRVCGRMGCTKTMRRLLYACVCVYMHVLNVAHNQVGVAGARGLASVLGKFPALRSLNLSGNDLQDEGLAAVCRVVPQMVMLDTLAVSGNGITDVGADDLANALTLSPALTQIDLTANIISEDGQWSLAAARVSCRLGDGAGPARLVKIDVRRFRHFHPLAGLPAGQTWCFLCYTSEACRCPVFNGILADRLPSNSLGGPLADELLGGTPPLA